MFKAKPSKRGKDRKASGRIIFVLGGAASGKSDVALRLAGSKKPQAFVATGQSLDAEMADRIARHRSARSSDWETVEITLELAAWFTQEGKRYRTIVLDCVTLWLANLQGRGVQEPAVTDKVSAWLNAVRASGAVVVIVSNELGMGLVPADPSTRSFRDWAGRVNQQIADEADEVHLVVGGIQVQVK